MIQNATVVGSNVSMEDYAADPAQRGDPALEIRAHHLIEILRNPQRWVRGYQSPESKARSWGSKLDCLLLTPDAWPLRYAVLPEDAPRKPTSAQRNAKKPSPETVIAIQWWDQFKKDNKGEIIDAEEAMEVRAACARIREDTMIAELVDASRKQVLVRAVWADPATKLQVPLKCLIDVVPPRSSPVFGHSVWDTKTTRNAAPRAFSRDAQRYRYDVQAAFYLEMWNTATNEGRTDFGHVIVENYAPYEFRSPPPLLARRFLALGDSCFRRALAVYCRCLYTGIWPGYTSGNDWPETDCDNWFLETEETIEIPEETEGEL